ncbi:MAG: hypothetical protein IPJ09_02450 [Saprospiraceae bacterium]|nr:hypothetical protein [Saprospiraceae bacterium]
MKNAISLLACFLFLSSEGLAQNLPTDFNTKDLWSYDSAQVKIENGMVTLQSDGSCLMVYNGKEFSTGEIEFDLRGRDVFQHSFLGLAFNIQSKETYRNTQVMELIYFRPFNFNNPERITHSLQYTFEPVYPWHVLRSNFPETYENKIIPAPPAESWVHAKVIIGEKKVQVFVNNNALPSLEVSRLAIIIHGKFGLWCTGDQPAEFKNLVVRASK